MGGVSPRRSPFWRYAPRKRAGREDGPGVSPRRSPFWRYVALQVPGWVLAAGIGWWIRDSFDAPVWLAPAVPLVWFVKDMALYPLLRNAYDVNEAPPVERLIGSRGVAVEPLAPSGYVRIGGELWRARTCDATPIAPHLKVEVVGAEGLLLSVRPAADEEEGRRPA